MTEPATVGTKVCPKCERELHVLAFASDKATADGLKGHCRECWSKYMHKRYVVTAKRPHSYKLGST